MSNPVVVAQNEVAHQVIMRSQIDVDDMQDRYVATGAYNHVPIGGTKTVDLPNGGTVEQPVTIQDKNPHFNYIWLSAEDLRRPEFAGYAVVSVSNEGGSGIPKHRFNSNGVIQVDEQFYCYSKAEYAKTRRAAVRERHDRMLAQFARPSEQNFNAEGQRRVVSFGQEGFTVDAPGERIPEPGKNRKGGR